MQPARARVPPRRIRFRNDSVIPGFGLTFGITLTWLALIVFIPLTALMLNAASLSADQLWAIFSSERTLNALKISFGISFLAAIVNVIFGLAIAWALTRYEFPGKGIADALVDVPFALPTAVAGIALTALYAQNGWIGSLLAPLGIQVAFTQLGILVALIFVGLPFVVRTVQPVLLDLDAEIEQAATSLGASRWQTITKVILPSLLPAIMTGFALSFARAVGEYGSVIFIAGNLPNVTEIAPLLIVIRLEEYRYADATAIAAIMLVTAFIMLFIINRLQRWAESRG